MAFLKNSFLPANHVAQQPFPRSRFSPAHRCVHNRHPFFLTRLRQLAHGAGHDRAVDHDDRFAPPALQEPGIAQDDLFYLGVIDDGHCYDLRMFA